MEDIEVWKQITNYDNYEVSTFGNVKNTKTNRILKSANRGGYLSIVLCKNSKGQTIAIHRLVALAFIDNPDNKSQVNHKDKIRSNNNVNNLEWNTAIENSIHRSNGVKQTTNQNVAVWRINGDTNEKLQLYDCISNAAKWCFDNNYSTSQNNAKGYISCASRGLYTISCGFKWSLNIDENLEGEIWKNVKINANTIVNDYFVSNLGRFKNNKGIIMKNYKPHHSGYIYIRINIEKYALHRIVATTFIENSNNKPVVNHIDGIKTNNAFNNLEWVTVQENNQHNHNVGLIKCFTRKIGQYDLAMNLIKAFTSIVQAQKELNIQTIKQVLYNKQNTAGGFIFKYLD
jgi:hypothetical protein